MRIVLIARLGAVAAALLTAAAFAQLSPPPAAASAPAAAPDDVFKEKGLTKVGFLLVTPQEAEVHASANSVRGLKAKVGAENLARASMGRVVQKATDAVIDLESQLANLDAKMASLKKKAAEYNQLVEPFNDTLKELRARKAALDELKKKLGKIDDSQIPYSDAAIAAARKAEAATAAYADLALDSALKAAIDKYNHGASQPLKLGPSGNFSNDVAFLKKCLSDMAAEGVPVRMDNGVPVLAVTINGVTHDMIWDSGASAVSLSAETAAEFGLHATSHDRTIVLTVADGRKVENKLIVVPSIRVGMFTADNVECVIAPSGKIRGPDLLGGTFQRHFLCRLDQAAGVLHLTPNDKQASTDRTAVATVPPATPPVAAPTPTDPPKPTTAPAPAPAPEGIIHLLPLVEDADLDKLGWMRQGAAVVSDERQGACLTLPYLAPQEYDLSAKFSRLSGKDGVLLAFPVGSGTCTFEIGGYDNTRAIMGELHGKWASNDNPAFVDASFSSNERHEMEVKVRRDGIEGYLDGKRICSLRGAGEDFGNRTDYCPRSPGLLSIGSFKSSTAFYAVDVNPVSGVGAIARQRDVNGWFYNPAVLRPSADGAIQLSARDATVHGKRITYESGSDHRCLGKWESAEEYVTWFVEVPRTGDYAVAVSYSCTRRDAGSDVAVALEPADGSGRGIAPLILHVQDTGAWNQFRAEPVGNLHLPAGRQLLSVRATLKPHKAVMNLQQVVLTPVR